MPIANGTRLGPYEVIRSIGAGGMGEVYSARDTRLHREVAIKILPEHVSGDEVVRARFLREARAISALSHPHICSIFDIGREADVDFIVMELIEGETLSDRMLRGRIPQDAALQYGIEIADALDAAHRGGIIHRDLKPGNIMLSKSGTKLLDFGLAKPAAIRQVDPEAATAADRPEPLTEEGAVPGTLEFMAPEQLEQGKADERTDIFALGNILYRMFAGRAPFAGSSAANLMVSIMGGDPASVKSLQPEIPSALSRLISDCLRKDSRERVQSAHDVKLALETIRASSDENAPAARRTSRRALAWALLAVAATAVALGIALVRRGPSTSVAVQRFMIDLPPLAAPLDGGYHDFVISPDGTKLVLSLQLAGNRQLYVRSAERSDLVGIPNTANAVNPFFSPDGHWIGFAADGKLHKIALEGGSPVAICDAPRSRGATWSPEGTIVFAPTSYGEGLFRVSADGGQPERVTSLAMNPKEHSHRWPYFLPDGRHVLFTIDDWSADYTRKKVAVIDLKTGERKTLVDSATDPRFVPGYLIFARSRSLFAIAFDADRLTTSGLPFPVLDGVMTHAGTGSALADVSRTGTLIYAPYAASIEERELVWVDRHGNMQPLSNDRRAYVMPALSPDNTKLLVGVGESRAADVWLLDIGASSWSRILLEGKSIWPIWSADGRQVIFTSNRAGPPNVYIAPADGSSTARRLTSSDRWPFPRSVSKDGRVLLTEEQDSVTNYDIWSVPLDGSLAKQVIAGPGNENDPGLSSDGRWLVYTSNETGSSEVYVAQYPPTGRKWLVSQGGGTRPRWSGDGSEIFFRRGRGVFVARVKTSPELSVAKAELLFEGDFALDYDVSEDGKRFVMLRENTRAREAPSLAVILGWSGEVRKRSGATQ